jgi:alcohol dehydrogenase, propanol-preferring
VVVKVGAAGACHSDLHLMHGPAADSLFPLPFTLGHENAGWVHAVGDGVTSVAVGLPVAVYGAWGCGFCERCAVGMSNYCDRPPMAPGLGANGGMADYLLVPDPRYLVPLPEGMTPAQAAPLTDAGLTPYQAVRRSLPLLSPTSTALVIGVGGLGHLAIQILKATSATRIVAVDARPEALELALAVGADVAILAGSTAASEIRTATRKRGAEVVLDFVGSDDTLALAAASTRSLGDLTVVGVAGGCLPFTFGRPAYGVSIQSVYWGSRQELVEVLELSARGLLTPHATTYPLEQAVEVYRALAAGEIVGRAVMVPSDPAVVPRNGES